MIYGYAGKIAFINLTDSTITIEERSEDFYRKTLGGEGVGAWLINEKVPRYANPLGPENGLCIATGLLTESRAPSSSRVMVMTKSPLTGGFGDSNAGGAFGPELKRCGFDALYIHGVAEKPVYISVTNDSIQIKDASHLMGKDTVETKETLVQEYNDSKIKVASIGIGGENKSLISAILFDDRAAARSGVGAVMGSKNLKCIVARGSKKIEAADPDRVKELNKSFRKFIMNTDYFVIDVMRKHGSCGFMSIGIKAGIGPVKNWSLAGEESYPQHKKIDGENVTKYQKQRLGCLYCPIACGGMVDVEDGPFKSIETRKPEYETIQAFAPHVMCDDIEACIRAQEICDRAGLDTISVGHSVSYAIECFENGILTKEDTGGLELGWGNAESMIQLTEKICNREEGIGKILADGVKIAAEKIGKGSEEYAIHIGGQEPAFHDFRYEAPSRGVTYISDPTPARHERCSGGQVLQLGKALGPYKEFEGERVENSNYKKLGQLYAKGSKYYSAFSSCGFCAYVLGATSHLPIVDLIQATMGWDDFTAQEVLDSGERAQTLRQVFSLREGLTPDKVKFPARLQEPPMFEGALKGSTDKIDWYKMREKLFEGFSWDPKTGKPALNRMAELGIQQFDF